MCCAFTIVGLVLMLALASFVGIPLFIRWMSQFDNRSIFDLRVGDRRPLANGFELALVDIVHNIGCPSRTECPSPDNFEVSFAIVPISNPVRSTRTLIYSVNKETDSDVNLAGFEVHLLDVWLDSEAAPTGKGQSIVNPDYRVRFQVTYPDEGLTQEVYGT